MMYLITTILETNLLVNIQFKIINQLNNFMFFFTSTNFVYGFIKIEFHCFRNRYCNCQKKLQSIHWFGFIKTQEHKLNVINFNLIHDSSRLIKYWLRSALCAEISIVYIYIYIYIYIIYFTYYDIKIIINIYRIIEKSITIISIIKLARTRSVQSYKTKTIKIKTN